MAKYIWTSNDFKRCLRSLYEAKSKEKDFEILKIIDFDILMLKSYLDFDFDEHKPQDDYLKMYRLAKNYLKQISYTWDDLKEFYTLTKGIIVKPNLYLKTLNLSNEDLITLTHDFYQSLGGNIYHTFMKAFKEKDNHLSFQKSSSKHDSRSFILPVTYLDEYFVKIYKEKCIEDLISIVHEYGHVIAISTNYKYNIDSFWGEIIPILMGLLVLDYYHKLTNDKNVFLYNMAVHNQKTDQSCSINDLLNIIKAEKSKFKNEYEFRKTVKDLNISDKDLDLTMEDINSEAYCYLPAYMIAIELYMQYKKDPEKTLYNLQQMLNFKLVNLKEDYQKLKLLGIEPNLYLEEFQEDLNQKELTLKH